MELAIVHTRVRLGVEAPEVQVEDHLSNGLPALNIVGLPETAVRESKDRVRSALINGGFEFPAKRITVNLKPDTNNADIQSQPTTGLQENGMSLDDAPEHVKLAVDMIRQMENLAFPNETVLEACLLVIQDTLNKMEREDRLFWRNRISGLLSTPGSKKRFHQGTSP